MDESKKMILNDKRHVSAANELIKGKQGKMSLQLARMIRIAISQISATDLETLEYNCKLVNLANFLQISKNDLYRDIEKITDEGLRSVITIRQPDMSYKKFQWLSLCRYNNTNGTLTIRLHNELKPYITQLESYFTQYQLENILQLNSYYAVRLYELIKCDDGITRNTKNYISYSIEFLREYFGCEKKYKRIADFKKKVIDISVREINNKSDYLIYPTYKKEGREIKEVIFEIHTNYIDYKKRKDT